MKYSILLPLVLIGFSISSAFALSDDEPTLHQTMNSDYENMLESGKPFPIGIHETVEFDQLDVTFSGIEDSRCPSDVTCVWEGQAKITFRIYDQTQHQAIVFTTGKVTTVYVGLYEINLVGITPYPTSIKDISEEYVATISISKNNRENIPAPLKQINTGVALANVKCNDGKFPAYKHNMMRVACVTEDTLDKLVDRGWSKPVEPSIHDPGLVESTRNLDDFIFAFYSEVARQDKKSNVFFSPLSISTAFSIAYEGAKGDTASQMQQVFGFEKDDSKRQEKISDILSRLNHKDGWYNLQVANALWIKDEYKIKQDYLDVAETYYSSTVDNVDFVTDDGIDTINNWVREKTNDKIQEILAPGSTDEMTLMVITNAVYFKGKWSSEFNPRNTSEKPFWIDKDNSVMIPMMKQPVDIYNYVKTENLQALELNYLGGDISMIVLLPKDRDGLESLEQSMDKKKFDVIKDTMTRQPLTLQMPKFEFETEYNLVSPLQSLGLHEAFDENNADFQGITDEQVYLAKAAHKAFVNVNEEGTEAAAITALVAGTTSGPPEPVAEFVADHPFVFVIQEKDTGEILFIGRLANPLE